MNSRVIVLFFLFFLAPWTVYGAIRVVGVVGNEAKTKQFIEERQSYGFAPLRAKTQLNPENGNLIVHLTGRPVDGEDVLVYLPPELSPDQLMEALIKVQTSVTAAARSVTVVCEKPLSEIKVVGRKGIIPLDLDPLFRIAGATEAREGKSEKLPPARELVKGSLVKPKKGGEAVFSSIGHPDLAERLGKSLGIPYAESLDSVSNAHAYLVLGAGTETNENFLRGLSTIQELNRGNSTAHVIMPYLYYARSDKVDVPGVGVTVSLVARLLEAVGASRVTVMRAHSAQSMGSFRIPNTNLSSRPTLVRHLRQMGVKFLISPDGGAEKETGKMAKLMNIPSEAAKKVRDPETGKLISVEISGIDLKGKTVAVLDDEISSGGSTDELIGKLLARPEKAPEKIVVVVTHLAGSARKLLQSEHAHQIQIVVTDTIPTNVEAGNLKVVSSLSEFARHLRRIERRRRNCISLEDL